MNNLLNPYQKASLATVLRMFEENLRQAETWLNGQQVEGILYRQELHLTSAQRDSISKHITAALAEIDTLARELGLEPEIENPADLIRGQMSIAWANLVDSQSSKMKRYGDIHPEAAREVDPHIQRLAQAALELAALFENHLSTPASPGAENIT